MHRRDKYILILVGKTEWKKTTLGEIGWIRGQL
jgi:hypothetical protein